MSVYLYRWGRFAYRRKWIVLPVWLLLFVVLGILGATLHKPMGNSFDIPNLPSERANRILDEHFPGMSQAFKFDAVTGVYVIGAPAGTKLTDTANRQALDGLVRKLGELGIVDHAKPLVDPIAAAEQMGCLTGDRGSREFVSRCSNAPLNVLNPNKPDTVAVLSVPFAIKDFGAITADDRKAAYDVADAARGAGLTVELSGTIAMEQQQPSGKSEMVGMAFAFVVMIICFGAVVAAFVPIITAVVGLGAATAMIFLGTAFLDVPSFTTFLASMIGIALSIDYALFIVSRYKHELSVQDSPTEAAGVALGTAGSAVVFAGLTVIIALVGLSIVGVRFLTFMGLGGAVAAGFAVLVALTLLPALLGAFGRFIFKPELPLVARSDPEDDSQVTNGVRLARVIGRVPVLTLILGIVVLGLIAAPAAHLQLGLPGEDSLPKTSTARKAYELRTEGFGAGSNGVLQIAVDLSKVAPDQRKAAVDALRDKLAGYSDMNYVTDPILSQDGQGARLEAVPKTGPNDQDTKDLVQDARAAESQFTSQYGMEYGITGTTAIYADIDQVLLGKILPYLAIVAGAAFLLLIAVFRSILVPLTAAPGFLLSMAATFGATVAIFQDGKLGIIGEPRSIISFMPIMLIGLVFGLAMDYQVFLVSRMREEYVHGAAPKEAMIKGYHHGARVVTSAAVIMIFVFGSFMMEPDVSAKSMGFALAAGVFFDAFLVRMVLIPSLLVLMGKRAWWMPGWLSRIVPDIDVEGARLREIQQREAAAGREEVLTR
ncbi:MMPL family transporter [Nocardia seriolae]|uniref:Membrane protein n=1 Tax=Nocardia seriolae TaxID=37332 RepID=A0A0B8NMU8_9NOCA|nr:MMPL family transporter [Nocardia seriolae]MTJ66427.1 MMPL family transporter [Nocardia seriolae]MTJ75889.1 MMPL family transporter [Nocardia seriolae]MTJ85670.1 MMPL family transporter [Nocardia seriolae]MTK29667.1 MMPL family transporter [Nocardia seriolae]MTK44418.1 MMPL family transporter [Nocardia seriolae]